MDLPAIVQAVEQACKDFQNPATRAHAEQALLEFRNSQQAFTASQYILQNSQDLQAQFQAVLALRHAALANWTSLTKAAQQGAVHFLLQYTMHHAPLSFTLVQAQCAAAAAALIKRGWEEMAVEERHALMQGIGAAATQAGTPHAHRASLQLLTAIVQEFSPATASPLGLPWDHHERCRASLEASYLQGFFVHALTTARESAAAAAAGADDGGLGLASLGLLSAILSWDFSRAGGSGVWRLDQGSRPNEAVHVRPPPSWSDLLLSPDSFTWLEGLMQACRGPQKMSTPLARAARQLLCLLCSLSGDIFPRQPGGGAAHAGRAELGLSPATPQGPLGIKDLHLLRVLRMLLPLVAPPAAAVHAAAASDESELLDACRGVLAAAAVHRAPGFERAAAVLDLPHPGGVLGLLSDLTQAVLGAGGADPQDMGWSTEAADMLLETWVELLADPCRGPVGSSPAAVAAAGAVFSAVMEAALRDAAAGALEDAEDEEGGEGAVSEEWLDRVAAVGRAAAPLTLPALAQRVQQCQAELASCLHTGRDPSATLEQLCWMVTMAGHVLADAGEGETPMVPLAILEACTHAWAGEGMAHPVGQPPAAAAAGGVGQDGVVGLSQCLVGVGRMCLEEGAWPVISPRLMEVVVTALGRWADTYLMMEDPPSPALELAFGGPQGTVRSGHPHEIQQRQQQEKGGPGVLEILVQLLLAALTRFPGDRTLHQAACQKLLGPLARRWEVSRVLVASPAWVSLVEAVGGGAPGVVQLDSRVQRRLVQGVCLSAEGLRAEGGEGDGGTSEAAERYISAVMRYTVTQLQAMGAEDEANKGVLQRPDTIIRAAGLLESLRGAARGVLPHTEAAVFAQFTAVSQPLVILLGAFLHHPALVALILKLAAELAEGVVGVLSAQQAGAFFAWTLDLLKVYASANLGQVSVQAAPSLQAEQQAERYKDLRALLKLLTNLSHRDWSDASALATAEARQRAGDDVAQVVFAGLDIILPLVSLDLLKFPKLGRQYFTLLSYMVEVYPDRVSTLPPHLFQSLLGTLRYGVGVSGDPEITQSVFEALAALAKFHAVDTAGGRPGLGTNNNPTQEGGPSVLAQLLQATLERILQDDAGHEAVDHASEALLPLILGQPDALQAAGEALLASLPDQGQKDKVTAAFLELTNGIDRSLDRSNRQRFRANLIRFAGEVRGAVRVR